MPRDAPDPRSAGLGAAGRRRLVDVVAREPRPRALPVHEPPRPRPPCTRSPRRGCPSRSCAQGDEPRERLLERFRERRGVRPLRDRELLAGRRHPRRVVLLRRDRPPAVRRAERAARAGPLRADRPRRAARAFAEYALPAAALVLKQGFGRLLRTDDRPRGRGRARRARCGPRATGRSCSPRCRRRGAWTGSRTFNASSHRLKAAHASPHVAPVL